MVSRHVYRWCDRNPVKTVLIGGALSPVFLFLATGLVIRAVLLEVLDGRDLP